MRSHGVPVRMNQGVGKLPLVHDFRGQYHLIDERAPADGGFDLLGVDVLSALGDDHGLATTGDVEEAVGVHHAHVSGVQPAIGVVHRLGGLWSVVVPGEEHRAPGADFAVAVAVRLVDADLHLVVHLPRRAHALYRGRGVGDDGGRLGEAVVVDDIEAQGFELSGLAQEQVRTGREDAIHARQAHPLQGGVDQATSCGFPQGAIKAIGQGRGRRRRRLGIQPLEHAGQTGLLSDELIEALHQHRHDHHEVDPARPDGLEHHLELGGGQNRVGGVGEQREQEPHHRGPRVMEGQDGDPAFAHAPLNRHQGQKPFLVGHDGAVAHVHAEGGGKEDNRGDVLGVHRGGGPVVRAGVEERLAPVAQRLPVDLPIVPVGLVVVEAHHLSQVGQVSQHGLDALEILRRREDHRRLAEPEHLGRLIGREEDVQGGHRGAHRGGTEVGDRPLNSVLPQEPHPVALVDAQVQQRVAYGASAILYLTIGDVGEGVALGLLEGHEVAPLGVEAVHQPTQGGGDGDRQFWVRPLAHRPVASIGSDWFSTSGACRSGRCAECMSAVC